HRAHRARHSFPTRRSSDLGTAAPTSTSPRRRPVARTPDVAGHSSTQAKVRAPPPTRGGERPSRESSATQDLSDPSHPLELEDELDRKSTRLNSSHVKISYA